MERSKQVERAETFHQLHNEGGILVLPNAWDAVSARIIEQAGAKAIATTSAGIAWSRGYPDGQKVNFHELKDATERICRVVSVPVTADIERGFSDTPSEVSSNVKALIDIGVVGINIEDGVIPGTSTLVSPESLADKISDIRNLAQNAGVPLFINARTDTYFVMSGDPVARYEETLRRAHIYVEAGADGIFTPGIESLDEMNRMAQSIKRPLNIYAGYAGLPPVKELREAGVRRVSLGCGILQAVLAATQHIVTEVLHEGTYTVMTADMLSASEVNELFANKP